MTRELSGDVMGDRQVEVGAAHILEVRLVKADELIRFFYAYVFGAARSHGGDITLSESALGGLRAVVRVPM